MSALFNISEVVGMATLIETNGEAFYDSVRDSARDTRAREVYTFLAQEEKKHRDTFEKLGKSLEKYRPVESYPGEHTAYMKALADDNVFTQKDVGGKMAQKASSASEVVASAIEFEKDSILFFEQMLRFVPRANQAVIQQLIDEEKTHILKLKEL